jgi:serpin B
MKTVNVLLSALAAVLLTCVAACQEQDAAVVEEPETALPSEAVEAPENELPPFVQRSDILLTDGERQVAGQTNDFAFELLRRVYEDEDADANIFISPLSASLALQMLDNGAAGDTHREIQTALGLDDLSREDQNSYAQKMINAMREADPRCVFESANSIWIDRNFPVLESFTDANRRFYEAEVRNEDFGDPAILKLINGWVNEKTHGRIPELINGVSPQSVMYLINTLYFYGYWDIPFMKEATTGEAFHNMDGSTPVLPTMKKTAGSQNYAREAQFAMLSLPFGNGTFRMLVALPDPGVSLHTVAGLLDATLWNRCMSDLNEYTGEEIHVRLPRFRVEYARTLNDDLRALGMPSIFDPAEADFSRINPAAGLCVSTVLQKTFGEVNETGMEAAAATVIDMLGSNMPETPPVRVDFYVDRPFLLFVEEQSTGTILFAGAIRNL